jgi:hypothetical protein
MAHLARLERIGEIDDPKALREPGEGDDRAVKALRWLMAAGHRRLRRSVGIEAGDLIGRDRHRRVLIGDVVDPRKGRRRRPELGHVLVGHDHDVAAAQFFAECAGRCGSDAGTPGWY